MRGLAAFGLLLVAACATAPRPNVEIPKTDRISLDVQVSPCVEPGGELHIAAEAVGLPGLGSWDGGGIYLQSMQGRGVLVEQERPRIVMAEGGEASSSPPDFEWPQGLWSVWLGRRFVSFGEGDRMRVEAIARIVPNAVPRTIVIDATASVYRRAPSTEQVETKVRSVSSRIAHDCGD